MKGPEYLGLSESVFWFGRVEDKNDPTGLGRIKVRIFNWYDNDTEKSPTDKLPWAIQLMPVTSGSHARTGVSPSGSVGLQPGSWVFGMFLDGKRAQFPMVMGTIHGKHATQAIAGNPAGSPSSQPGGRPQTPTAPSPPSPGATPGTETDPVSGEQLVTIPGLVDGGRSFSDDTIVTRSHPIWSEVHPDLASQRGTIFPKGANPRMRAGTVYAANAVYNRAAQDGVKMRVAIGGGNRLTNNGNHGRSFAGESLDIKPVNGWTNKAQVAEYAKVAQANRANRLGLPDPTVNANRAMHIQQSYPKSQRGSGAVVDPNTGKMTWGYPGSSSAKARQAYPQLTQELQAAQYEVDQRQQYGQLQPGTTGPASDLLDIGATGTQDFENRQDILENYNGKEGDSVAQEALNPNQPTLEETSNMNEQSKQGEKRECIEGRTDEDHICPPHPNNVADKNEKTVIRSTGSNVLRFSDNEGATGIHLRHGKTGTNYEIDDEGNVSEDIKGARTGVTRGFQYLGTKDGSIKLSAGGDIGLGATDNVHIGAKNGNLSLDSKGGVRIGSGGDLILDAGEGSVTINAKEINLASTDGAVNFYSRDAISMISESIVSISSGAHMFLGAADEVHTYSGGPQNIYAKGGIAVEDGGGGISMVTPEQFDLFADSGIRTETSGKLNLKAASDMNLQAEGDQHISAGSGQYLTGSGDQHIYTGGSKHRFNKILSTALEPQELGSLTAINGASSPAGAAEAANPAFATAAMKRIRRIHKDLGLNDDNNLPTSARGGSPKGKTFKMYDEAKGPPADTSQRRIGGEIPRAEKKEEEEIAPNPALAPRGHIAHEPETGEDQKIKNGKMQYKIQPKGTIFDQQTPTDPSATTEQDKGLTKDARKKFEGTNYPTGNLQKFVDTINNDGVATLKFPSDNTQPIERKGEKKDLLTEDDAEKAKVLGKEGGKQALFAEAVRKAVEQETLEAFEASQEETFNQSQPSQYRLKATNAQADLIADIGLGEHDRYDPFYLDNVQNRQIISNSFGSGFFGAGLHRGAGGLLTTQQYNAAARADRNNPVWKRYREEIEKRRLGLSKPTSTSLWYHSTGVNKPGNSSWPGTQNLVATSGKAANGLAHLHYGDARWNDFLQRAHNGIAPGVEGLVPGKSKVLSTAAKAESINKAYKKKTGKSLPTAVVGGLIGKKISPKGAIALGDAHAKGKTNVPIEHLLKTSKGAAKQGWREIVEKGFPQIASNVVTPADMISSMLSAFGKSLPHMAHRPWMEMFKGLDPFQKLIDSVISGGGSPGSLGTGVPLPGVDDDQEPTAPIDDPLTEEEEEELDNMDLVDAWEQVLSWDPVFEDNGAEDPPGVEPDPDYEGDAPDYIGDNDQGGA